MAYIVLPPAAAHSLLDAEPAFGTRRYNRPKPATFCGDDDWESSEIAFDDFSRMHLENRSPGKGRRLPTPTWATNDAELQRLLVIYYERRAHIQNPQGSLSERLRTARQKLLSQIPVKVEVMNRLCAEYVNCTDPTRRRRLEIEIENLDSQITADRDIGPGMVARIVKLYYSLGLNSVEVSRETQVKPIAIRQILHRLWLLADGKSRPPRSRTCST